MRDNPIGDQSYTYNMLSHLETDDQWRLMICIAIDNGSDNTVGGSYYSAHQAVGKYLEHTERNKLYILTHLGESGYCPQINPNYQVNWPNCCKFLGQWPRSLWNPRRWKLQFTPQPATQFTVLCYWEVSVRISLWHWVFMEICLIFYSYYIVTRGYIYTPCWLCLFCTY